MNGLPHPTFAYEPLFRLTEKVAFTALVSCSVVTTHVTLLKYANIAKGIYKMHQKLTIFFRLSLETFNFLKLYEWLFGKLTPVRP